jgi:transcriptional regulator with XRE-family HTH domain
MPSLRAIRVAQQLTLGQLAHRAHLTRHYLAAMEAGYRPQRHTIYHLAAVLGVAPEAIDEFRPVLLPTPLDALRTRRAPLCATHAHWMTSVAWASTWWGIVRPRAWAVLRLMTNSKRIGCSMGRSAGLAPLRIRSTK